jgi:serine/threonine protein kinase
MAPEQVRGLGADHRVDIFAFGCVLYEMLSGRRAFKGPTPADTMSAILMKDPPPLVESGADIPAALQEIVSRCLEKRPEDRFSSAHDLALTWRSLSTFGPAGPLKYRHPRGVAWRSSRLCRLPPRPVRAVPAGMQASKPPRPPSSGPVRRGCRLGASADQSVVQRTLGEARRAVRAAPGAPTLVRSA